ncbi:MAG: hypothetical protein EOR07_19650 [Mesorhizobium sp.]|nr:MAG: hypothetical protein EOR07_19650 [Mesorhizobium sp.]
MLEGSLPRSRKHFNFLNLFSPRFFQHPSSVSALRADPPSPTRGEGHSRVLAGASHPASIFSTNWPSWSGSICSTCLSWG